MVDMVTTADQRQGIPLELLKCIIDILRDDIDSLRLCALVCKDWVPVSRYYVGLVIDDWFRGIHRTYDRLIELLSEPNANSAPYWRHLKIQTKKLEVAELVTLLSMLPSLQSLSVHVDRWGESWCSAHKELSRFKGITELALDGKSAADPNEILALACALPSLEKLDLCGFEWPESTTFSSSHKPSRILRTLRLRYCSIRPILNWIMSIEAMPPLHTLILQPAPKTDFQIISDFLRKLGDSLRHLEVYFLATTFIESAPFVPFPRGRCVNRIMNRCDRRRIRSQREPQPANTDDRSPVTSP
jgi:hypothetical protein